MDTYTYYQNVFQKETEKNLPLTGKYLLSVGYKKSWIHYNTLICDRLIKLYEFTKVDFTSLSAEEQDAFDKEIRDYLININQ